MSLYEQPEASLIMEIKTIVLHHTASAGKGSGGDEWNQICQACSVKRGSTYICDYHFGIGPTGQVFDGQPIDRPAWHSGNDDINDASLAVACIGNFEENPMGVQQEKALIALVVQLKNRYPLACVMLHKEIVATLCPGRFFPARKVIDAIYGQNKYKFSDLPVSNIFHKAIMAIVEKGIMHGDSASEGTFRPDDPVTRGELAQVLYNLTNKA